MTEEKITYKIELSISVSEIKDVITTAVEGGIGYWACLHTDLPGYLKAREQMRKEMPDGPCYCDVIYRALQNGDGVTFEDEEEGKLYDLTMEKLLNGIVLYEQAKGKSISKALEEGDFDAWDGDAVFQFALFGEVIYG